MPVSLRAKLAAIDAPKKPSAPAVQPLYIKETVYPLSDFHHLLDVTGQLLHLMDGRSYPDPLDPESILYLDTETTGLAHGAGTVAFLIGVGFVQEESFIVRQYLMRDYSQESQVLKHLMCLLPDYEVLVTFNGRSFDVPLLQSRLIMNRLDPECLNIPHVDLLHIARRIFKLRLKHCRLIDLEAELFNAPREDDLPGALVPQRYFDYLKTGNFSLLTDILEHNAQDIASLGKLLGHMGYMYQKPEQQSMLTDVYAMGLAFEKRKEFAHACRCYHLATKGKMASSCYYRLGLIARREKDYRQSLENFRQMIKACPSDHTPWIEMAKIYEHRLKDIESALECTRKAVYILAEPHLMENPAVQETQNALQYRYMRLMRKLQGEKRQQP